MFCISCRYTAAAIALGSMGCVAQASPVPGSPTEPTLFATGSSSYFDQRENRDDDSSYAIIDGPGGMPRGWEDGSRVTLEITTDGTRITSGYLTVLSDVMFNYWSYWTDELSPRVEWSFDEAWTTTESTRECDIMRGCAGDPRLHDLLVTDTSVIFTIDTPTYSFGCHERYLFPGSGDCWERNILSSGFKLELFADQAFSYEVNIIGSELVPYDGPEFPYYATAAADVAPVPLPAGFGLLLGALGLAGLGFGRHRVATRG